MLWSCFHVLVWMLNICTSPFLLVFFPPIRIISAAEIDRALHAHKGFFTVKNYITYLHPNSKNTPYVLINLVDFNAVIDFLFCAPKEPSKGIYKFIPNSTCTQVVSFIFHRCDLSPLVFLNNILLYRIKSLLPRETTQHKHMAPAHCYCMRISTLIH